MENFGKLERRRIIVFQEIVVVDEAIDLSEKSNRVGIAFYRVGVGVLGSWGKTKK